MTMVPVWIPVRLPVRTWAVRMYGDARLDQERIHLFDRAQFTNRFCFIHDSLSIHAKTFNDKITTL